jgi:pimeloyl-ACP methyl ester carboxylesterase
MKLVENAFDRNGDGTLDPAECAAARIILYGHSFGGAAVVKLARELKERGIPVVLTVEVDSIGLDGAEVPANVARAVNFYQRNSIFLRGRRIHAEDPARTAILGNFRIEMDGRKSEVPHSGLHWMEGFFGGAHAKLAFDHDVWQRVEKYILAEVRPADLRGSDSFSGNPQQ